MWGAIVVATSLSVLTAVPALPRVDPDVKPVTGCDVSLLSTHICDPRILRPGGVSGDNTSSGFYSRPIGVEAEAERVARELLGAE
jgi:hypothetical protein